MGHPSSELNRKEHARSAGGLSTLLLAFCCQMKWMSQGRSWSLERAAKRKMVQLL